tara:strand:+ start:13974 stop:14444 length:471 start_codon:yes stop_codon:yes gene_type:complete
MKNTKKVPTPTSAMIDAATVVLSLRNEIEKLSPSISKIHEQVLYQIKPVYTLEGTSIGEPIEIWDYLYMTDEDTADKCYRMKHTLLIEAGFDLELYRCPILTLEESLRGAERGLNKMCMALIPDHIKIDVDKIYDAGKRKKLTDLNLKFIMASIKS